MPTLPPRTVLLCFDGVVHDSDLPVQAFARHLTERLPTEQIRPMIGGMRGFLEGRSELVPPGVDLSAAEDGYQAVDILARAAGLGDSAILMARQASRADLAASAWAVDRAAGWDALLAEIGGRARVALISEPADPAVAPVIDALDLVIDEILAAPAVLAVAEMLRQVGATPDRLLIIGTRWTEELRPASEAGCTTALIDRFGHGRGTPTFRSPDLAGLLEPIELWLGSSSVFTTAGTAR